ncbi:glycosyltransferase family 1 protein [Cytobacillus firmus]|uniref:glycosyltransferase family 1 protein n=1 Tax=Cytobacillus firmus TaxID=1399 RepID=UPI0024C1800B|nr:glycosyltransferase family 1 protein [Cytobacillus firmus]WHY33853.1 glycosyltransferase family 1 protein [Cytobacillus firmus]
MIRVLHVVGKMNRGGIETFLMNVYRKIDRQKVQFDFLVHTEDECDYNEEIFKLGGKIYSIPPRKQGFFKNRKSLIAFFKKHQDYKVVHQHISSLSYVEPLKIATKFGIPIRIVHGHSSQEGGSFFNKYIHKWNQIGVKTYATDYFACSDTAAEWLYHQKHFRSGEFTIINNGIETARFAYNPIIRNQIRRELGIDNKFVVGNVGRLVHSKNHDFLLDIFKCVHDIEPETVLICVGDGELRQEIQEKVYSLELEDSVILTGTRTNISDLLQAMDIFIMPSLYEGLPVTLVEAQSSGLHCLVSDRITRNVNVTDLIEYININNNAEYWAEKAILLYQSQKRKVTTNQIIKSGFDVKGVAKHLEEFYIKTLKGRY